MKSEHRHELQENDLTKYADHALAWVKNYGNTIMVVICVVSIVASIIIYRQRVTYSRVERAWSEVASARNSAELQSILSDAVLSQTSAAPWATIREAEDRLQEGVRAMFSEREKGKRDIESSLKSFEAILETKPAYEADIRERALFGLAKSQESISDGKLDVAIATYERLLKEFPNSLFKKNAEGRIAELKRKDAGQFYAWFAKQNPTTSTTRLPADRRESDTTKKKPTGTSGAGLDLPTTLEPLPNVPLNAPGADKTLPPSSVDDELPEKKSEPKKDAGAKATDSKAPAAPADKKADDKKAAAAELPPLQAPAKDPAAKPPTATPPAKNEPAKTDAAPKGK